MKCADIAFPLCSLQFVADDPKATLSWSDSKTEVQSGGLWESGIFVSVTNYDVNMEKLDC